MKVVRARAEQFGGIVELERPRALLQVDRELMCELGYPESARWTDLPQGAPAPPLSAPTEVHVVLSRRCAAGCRGCYVDATPQPIVAGVDGVIIAQAWAAAVPQGQHIVVVGKVQELGSPGITLVSSALKP